MTADAREALAAAYRRAAELGLNEVSSGNLSCRTAGGMLISPSGATGQSIRADNCVAMSLDGDWQGSFKPSSEWRMHAAVYRLRPEAGAVVHTHADHCVALASHGRALPGFHYLVGMFGGSEVPCVPYATFGTDRLGELAAGALEQRRACLLANHGAIVFGADLDEAVVLAQQLDVLCRQYLLACQFGEPPLLTDEDWADFFRQLEDLDYGRMVADS